MDRHARTVVCLVALLAVTASVVPIVGVPGAPVASEPTASAGSAVSNATASAGARATDDDGADVLSRGVRERLAAVRENGVSGVPFRVYVHTTPGEVERVARQVRERGRVRDVLVGERAVAATLTADALTDVASLDPVTEISREAQYALTAADRKAPARRGSTADVPAVARPARASSDLRTPTTTPGGNDSWGVQYVDAGPLHARGVNGSNVTVAVIDSGIDEAATPLDDHVVEVPEERRHVAVGLVVVGDRPRCGPLGRVGRDVDDVERGPGRQKRVVSVDVAVVNAVRGRIGRDHHRVSRVRDVEDGDPVPAVARDDHPLGPRTRLQYPLRARGLGRHQIGDVPQPPRHRRVDPPRFRLAEGDHGRESGAGVAVLSP